MHDMGLTYQENLDFFDILSGVRSIKISVTMLDLDHNTLANLSPYFYDGQVTINSESEVTRSASMTMFDPDRTLSLDALNPGAGAIYYDKMVQVKYFVWKPGTLRIYEIPVFTGPITDMERNGVFIDITAMGKEVLSLGSMWNSFYFNPGTKKYDLIRFLLAAVSGENLFDMVYRDEATAVPMAYGPEQSVWTECVALAESMGMQLFYDGRGYVRMRRRPMEPSFTFKDGDGGSIISKPKIKYNSESIRNAVLVRGATPSGASSPITATALAPAAHPYNHLKLGRTKYDGTRAGRVLLEIIEDTTIATQADAQWLADTKRDEFLQQGVSVSMDTACIPVLEEDDMAMAQVEGEYALPFRLRQFTIPLTVGPNATVNSNINVKIKRR